MSYHLNNVCDVRVKFAGIKSFFIGLGVIFFTGAVLYFIYPDFLASEIFAAYIYASALNLVNFSLALIFYSIGIKARSNADFLKFAMGGMIFRIFLVIFLVFILIKFLNIEKSSFILIFFIIYFILLVVEIYFYLKKLKREAKKDVNSGNS